MELNELHIFQLGPGVVGESHSIRRVFPGVRGNSVDLSEAARRQHDGLGLKDHEPALFAPIAERACDSIAVLQ